MPPNSRYLAPAGVALIIIATVLAYWPSMQGGFIFDDDTLLTDNMPVKASNGLYYIWFTTGEYEYYPISYSTLWLEWRLWGMHPTGYHVTNLALHIASTLLIWWVLHKLAIPGAFLAALLFAIHPVNVESVAWIAQRRNALALFFFVLSVLWYLRAEEKRGKTIEAKSENTQRGGELGSWYWLSLLAFLLSMLSKASVAVLPLELLALTWWRRGTVTRRDLLRAVPFFLVAAVLGGINVWFETHGSHEVIRSASFDQRLAGAGATIWFYLSKALLPIHLIFVYPDWLIDTGNLLWWLPLLALLIVTSLLFWRRNSSGWMRPLLFAWIFFCIALGPVMGFTDVGFMRYSLVADHYQYIAILAVVVLVAAGWSFAWKRLRGAARSVSFLITALGVAVLVGLCWRQNELYADAVTLYQATVQENPDCWMAHNNLGLALVDSGQVGEGILHYQKALEIKPNYAEAHLNLGSALGSRGKDQEALAHFTEAIRLNPNLPEAHYNLGNALAKISRLPEAIEQYELALQLRPDYAEAHTNLAIALMSAGRPQEAIEQYRQAVQINPESPEAQNNLGNALARIGRPVEAVEHLEAAARLKPDSALIHNNLGATLADLGRFQEAIVQYQQAIQLEGAYAGAYFNLAKALAKLNHPAEALAAAQKGLELAQAAKRTALIKQIDAWLKNYQPKTMPSPSRTAP